MDNPTILHEAAKLHYEEIAKEMISWRMANQANITRSGPIRRLVMVIETLKRKLVGRLKQENLVHDEHLILNIDT